MGYKMMVNYRGKYAAFKISSTAVPKNYEKLTYSDKLSA
jgi:hypothetical protein